MTIPTNHGYQNICFVLLQVDYERTTSILVPCARFFDRNKDIFPLFLRFFFAPPFQALSALIRHALCVILESSLWRCGSIPSWGESSSVDVATSLASAVLCIRMKK